MDVLFLVPHADDEVLGFGGTIHKYVQKGLKVGVCIVQAKNNDRAAEQLENSYDAKQVLGYQNLVFLNVPRQTFCNDLNYVIKAVDNLLSDISPQILFTTYKSDNHQDHKNLYQAVSVATRPHHSKIKAIYAGEVISSFNQSYGIERCSFIPNYYEVITELNLYRKIEALQKYKLEIQPHPHSRSPETIQAWSVARGAECNAPHAEAFMLLREVNE
jgi:LmbE family N-acetylglucosaminyl deacetylase